MPDNTKAFGAPPEKTFMTLLRVQVMTLKLIEVAGGVHATHAPDCGCAATIDDIRRLLAELEGTVAVCRSAFADEWERTAREFLDVAYARAQRDLEKVMAGRTDEAEAEAVDQSKKIIH